MLSRLNTCLFHAKDTLPASIITGREGQFISETSFKKVRGISDHFDMPATRWLSNDQDLGFIGTYDLLPVKTVKGRWAQDKRQHSPSNTYLNIFAQVSDPPAVLHAVH